MTEDYPQSVPIVSFEDRARLEDMGEAYVRQLCSAGVHPTTWDGTPDSFKASAVAWLAKLDAEQRERNEALQAEQTRLAKSTLWAAWIAAVLAAVGILVTVGLWYVQDQTAKAEAARHAAIRDGLQTLYEQGTDLMKEGLPFINSVDLDKINKFVKDGDHFGDTAEKWVQENIGKACVDRLLEVPAGFQQMHTSTQQLTAALNSLMILKRNLADLIDNDACGKGK